MIDETVQVDNNGNWQYQVPSDLPPGTYKITLVGQDKNGNPLTIPQTFTIKDNYYASTPQNLPQQNLPTTGLSLNSILLISGILVLTLALGISNLVSRKLTFEERVINNKN